MDEQIFQTFPRSSIGYHPRVHVTFFISMWLFTMELAFKAACHLLAEWTVTCSMRKMTKKYRTGFSRILSSEPQWINRKVQRPTSFFARSNQIGINNFLMLISKISQVFYTPRNAKISIVSLILTKIGLVHSFLSATQLQKGETQLFSICLAISVLSTDMGQWTWKNCSQNSNSVQL